MHKTNITFIVSFILLSTSSLVFYYWYSDDNKYFQPKSERTIEKYKSKAPKVIRLFNVENGQYFFDFLLLYLNETKQYHYL